tara:strand:+ start:141 stop:1274 length:1134 start_codon:yes stop_codon:yes gene_type:complete
MITNKKGLLNILITWFKTIDLFNLLMIIFLISLGILFVTTSSPSIALKKNLEEFYFIKKQIVFIIISLITLFIFSLFSNKGIIRISFIGGIFSTLLIILSLLQNQVNNGATRWIDFFGFSLQPSEFLKPFLIILFSYFLSNFKSIKRGKVILKGNLIAFSLLIFVCILLLLQPNFSMLTIIFFVFAIQYFIAGVNIKWLLIVFLNISIFSLIAYFSMPHVKSRINNYLEGNKPDYQVEKSIKAYQSGGYFGKGPGEGIIKKNIPDAHTDFIFPVIAEEYGIFTCYIIIITILSIFFRGLLRISDSENKFSLVACSGILVLFILQSFINISVSVKLIPTTGITLPLISYGGSSLISMSIALGIMLSFTRKKFGGIRKV